jgi:hypothetical protein
MSKPVINQPEPDFDEQCDICGNIGETSEYYDQQLCDNCMEIHWKNRVLPFYFIQFEFISHIYLYNYFHWLSISV